MKLNKYTTQALNALVGLVYEHCPISDGVLYDGGLATNKAALELLQEIGWLEKYGDGWLPTERIEVSDA